jgi:hypothetical protein
MKNINNEVTINILSGFWFWGFIYFLFMRHWDFWDAAFWMYFLINKHF